MNSTTPAISSKKIYTAPVIIVGTTTAWLFWVVAGEHYAVRAELFIAPMVALFALTALVWLIMVIIRNLAVIRGYTSIRHFADFKSDVPTNERLERPGRTFNNLMQVPTLFYVICILMLITKQADNAQIVLAWTFVVFRCFHAIIYMTVNWVPYRFATWASSCIILGVIWFRFVAQAGLTFSWQS